MNAEHPSDALLTRLRLLWPAARSFLVTSPRPSARPITVATELAASANRLGHDVELVDLTSASQAPGRPAPDDLAAGLLAGDLSGASSLLTALPGYAVVAADGLLDRGPPLLLAGAVDGVVLTVIRGRTARADLALSRRQIEEVGGRLMAAAYHS